MAMAAAVRHGSMAMVHADVLSAHCCRERRADRASAGGEGLVAVSGRGMAVRGRRRTMTTAGIGRSVVGFGCSSAETAAVSSSRMAMLVSSDGGRKSGSRREALRSRQSDVVGGEADAMTEDEPLGSFWDRLQQAWCVMVGAPSEAHATRQRFSRLLVRDRGFSSANLSRLYNAAKGAIEEHVELEGDAGTEIMAVVDRLGELRLDFRVKRVKSVLRDEPFSEAVFPDMDPSLSLMGEQLWEEGWTLPHDSEVRRGEGILKESFRSSALPDLEPNLSSIGSNQFWEESSRARLDLKARLGMALDRPSRSSVVPDVEPGLPIGRDQPSDDERAAENRGDHYGVSDLKSTTGGGALPEPFPAVVLPDVELSLASSGDQLLEENGASQDVEVRVEEAPALEESTAAGEASDLEESTAAGEASDLEKSTAAGEAVDLEESPAAGGADDEPLPNSVVPDVEPSSSTSGDESLQESKSAPDVGDEGDVGYTSTTDVDSEGEWYTFSFTDAKVEL